MAEGSPTGCRNEKTPLVSGFFVPTRLHIVQLSPIH